MEITANDGPAGVDLYIHAFIKAMNQIGIQKINLISSIFNS